MVAENLEQRRTFVDYAQPIGNPAAVVIKVAFAFRTAGTEFCACKAVVFEADFSALVLAFSLFQCFLHGICFDSHLQRVRLADEDDEFGQLVLLGNVFGKRAALRIHTVQQVLGKGLFSGIDAAVGDVLTVFQLDLGFGDDGIGIALIAELPFSIMRSGICEMNVAHVVAHDAASFESGVDGKQNLRILAIPDSLGAVMEDETAAKVEVVIDLKIEAVRTIGIEANSGIAAVMEAVAHGFGKGAPDALVAHNPRKLLMAAVQFDFRCRFSGDMDVPALLPIEHSVAQLLQRQVKTLFDSTDLTIGYGQPRYGDVADVAVDVHAQEMPAVRIDEACSFATVQTFGKHFADDEESPVSAMRLAIGADAHAVLVHGNVDEDVLIDTSHIDYPQFSSSARFR